MKALKKTAATTPRRKMNGDENQSSLLPSSSTVCRAERPIAMVAMPAQSPSFKSARRIGARSSVSASATTITALGTALM